MKIRHNNLFSFYSFFVQIIICTELLSDAELLYFLFISTIFSVIFVCSIQWLFKSATAEIELLDVEGRKMVEISTDKGTQKLYVYSGNEPVKGRVKVAVKKGDTIEHQGMRVDFIGQIGEFEKTKHQN